MNVAIIPARGGSKRIPKKNIRCFCGKPIIAYSIEAARRTGLFDRIIVSTESEEVAEVALAYGAEVPFLRPELLAGDHATTSEVLVHAVEWLKQHGGCEVFCCIYPTAPLLDVEDLRKGYEQVNRLLSNAAMSVMPIVHPVHRTLQLDASGLVGYLWPENRDKRSQDLPELFQDGAQFYWCRADAFLEKADILALQPAPIRLASMRSHDIDTPEDWEIAELKYLRLQRRTEVADVAPTTSPMVLGTAQLGFTYGIANRLGKPDAATANSMLCTAWAGGIRIFDTAQAYGDSEYVLGDFFGSSFGFAEARFITKLHPDVNVNDEAEIRGHVEESLRRLSIPRIWLLLLHCEQQLDQWSGTLGRTLRRLCDEGLIGHLGASVYGVKHALAALRNPDLSFVGIPGGVLDRRMKRANIVSVAAEYNKKLLVRSVFLQGLAFMAPEQISSRIPYAREATATLRAFCAERDLDAREFAYGYVRRSFPGAFVVLGAETPTQVRENCELDTLPEIDPGVAEAWDNQWPVDYEGLYNPATWVTSRNEVTLPI